VANSPNAVEGAGQLHRSGSAACRKDELKFLFTNDEGMYPLPSLPTPSFSRGFELEEASTVFRGPLTLDELGCIALRTFDDTGEVDDVLKEGSCC